MMDLSQEKPRILVVDDTLELRKLLTVRLSLLGYQTAGAENGRRALEMLRENPFDLVLLDIMMPVMDGYTTLQAIKADEVLRAIPVIVVSAVSELDSVVRCIELGAEDYLVKPYNNVLLKARIAASLERKRLHDREQAMFDLVRRERARAEGLLLNILPAPIAERLKAEETNIAELCDPVTVLFADIVDFTELSTRLPARAVVALLNRIFTRFDEITQEYQVEKIKTSGDAYMLAAGVPLPLADHAQRVAHAAIAMKNYVRGVRLPDGSPLFMRFGIHTGPVIAGVIGKHKFIYDIWGDTVNTASRVETNGLPNEIQVSTHTMRLLQNQFEFSPRGQIPVKGKGTLDLFLLAGLKNP
ncbi:MAG: hypothetical protein OHK0052_22310 [Anaerolineales bacterium]